jgi:hypothetical protein
LKRNRLDQCEEGDWADWDLYPSDKAEVYGSQRSIDDIDMVDGKITVLGAKEWTFKKAWVCVKVGRCE